jgi:hypothetical protein
MHLEEIDGLLHILDENYETIHLFERETRSSQNSDTDRPLLSRAAYKHMCGWVKMHWTPESDPNEIWTRAEKSWDELTPEQQMYLWTLSHQEEQNAQDLCTALLAHLSEYRGLKNVKKAFQSAIQSVLEQFS